MNGFSFWCEGFAAGFGSGLLLLCITFPFQSMKRVLGEAACSS